jgi:hypothetical protein
MSFNFPAFLIAAFFCLLTATGATAGDVVYFQSASVPPTPLKQRLAKERGVIAHVEPGIMIAGEMLRPTDDGPFPALVILHGCGRLSPRTGQIRAERYVSWGYVVLQFDSFAARGIESGLGKTCLNIPTVDRPLDAILVRNVRNGLVEPFPAEGALQLWSMVFEPKAAGSECGGASYC